MGLFSAAASVFAASKAASASKEASRLQAQTQQQALDEARRQFDVSREDQLPFLETGQQALYKLADLFGVPRPEQQQAQTSQPQTINLFGREITVPGQEQTPQTQFTEGFSGFQASPGYQFRLDQGVEAIDRAANARGLLNSGSRLKALNEFGQGVASEEFNTFANRLASLAGLGQVSGQSLGAQGSAFSRTNSSLLQGLGASQAAGVLGRNSAFQQGIQGVGAGIEDFFNKKNPDGSKRSLTERIFS